MLIEFLFYLWPFQDKWAPMEVNVIVHFELLTSFHICKSNYMLDAAVRRTFIKYFHFGNTILINILVTPGSNISSNL